jgi:N-acetyl-alpha-D-muramate 1-phosphate uridylyltransferase
MKAMILAAGRGERMRPLSDSVPKPLLEVGGKPLIVWQIERLVGAGIDDIVINVAHRGATIIEALGDGSRFGCTIRYSVEPEPLEAAGGIATALPMLGEGVALIVSADVYTEYDYTSLRERAAAMAAANAPPHLHMVMVPNPAYHPGGDFVLADSRLVLDSAARLTYGNIALYRTALFAELPRGEKLQILPLYRAWIAKSWVTGELYTGPWANVGTAADLAQLDRSLKERT